MTKAPEKERRMFLRFYGQPREVIQQCIDELAPAGLVNVAYSHLTQSCNPIVPRRENTQADLTFDTKKNLKAFVNNPATQLVYMKYAVAKGLYHGKEATPILRKPKDMAFAVR